MAATKSRPGRDGDEPQPRSAPILHTTSPLESGEILCRCGWVYWISNFCCGLGWLGRMEIGNPSMIKLTFEVWHLKQVWQGESDIDAILLLMVARIGCICHLCWGVDQRGWRWWTVSSLSTQVPRIPRFLARPDQEDYDGRGQPTAFPMLTAIMSGGVGISGRELYKYR